MSRDEVIKTTDDAFATVARPLVFIPGTCGCEECLEHNETMRLGNPKDLPLASFNNPGWDPICFASDEAFKYLMPGLVRLVLDHTDGYVQQFIWHIEQPRRLECLTPAQAKALITVLDLLISEHSAAVEDNLVTDSLLLARNELERVAKATHGPVD